MSLSYGELLKDPRWQKRRLEVFERDGWMCTSCESTDRTLEVHHKRYLYGRMPWDYEDDYLITLCTQCHREATRCTAALKENIRHLTTGEIGFLAGVAIGLRFKSAFFAEPDGTRGLNPWARETVALQDYNVAWGLAHVLGTTPEIIFTKMAGPTVALEDLLELYRDSPELFP